MRGMYLVHLSTFVKRSSDGGHGNSWQTSQVTTRVTLTGLNAATRAVRTHTGSLLRAGGTNRYNMCHTRGLWARKEAVPCTNTRSSVWAVCESGRAARQIQGTNCRGKHR